MGLLIADDNIKSNIVGDEALDEFLDVDNCLILSVSKEVQENIEKIKFAKEVYITIKKNCAHTNNFLDMCW